MLFLSLFICCLSNKNDTAEPPKSLIDLMSWRVGGESGDPYPDHKPEDFECPPTAFRIESNQLEVEMDICNYAHLVFESNQKVKAGREIEILILHTGLWAEQAALAHAVISHLDKEDRTHILFEEEPQIPAQAEFFFHEIKLEETIEKGDTFHLHLHNHGANDWRLGYIQKKDAL
jgi:hypothetical protein